MARPLKQIERWGKSLAVRAMAKILSVRHAPSPDWSDRPYRVLYLRYDRIGDMILSSGLYRALVTARPHITLDVLASPANRAVLAGNPRVHEVIAFDKRRWTTIPTTLRAVRRRHYDVVIDPMIDKPSLIATLLLLVSGAPYRVGVGGRDNAFAYTLPVSAPVRDAHHTIQEAALLEPFGIDAKEADLHPELFAGRAEREAAEAAWAAACAEAGGTAGATATDGAGDGAPPQRLLVNISTHHPSRRWPASRYAEVIRGIRSLHRAVTVIVISLPRDRAVAETIVRDCGARVVPTPGLQDALALVATADVVFTPDTSISHAASAFRTPAIVMIGPGRAAFEPFGNTGELLRATTDDFASVSATAAMEAIDTVLSRDAATHR